jgi:hypothetical protein
LRRRSRQTRGTSTVNLASDLVELAKETKKVEKDLSDQYSEDSLGEPVEKELGMAKVIPIMENVLAGSRRRILGQHFR